MNRWASGCASGLRRGVGADAGMVTAETAAVLPVLALVLSLAMWAVAAAAAQVRCSDAAREGVRAAARGESDARVRQLALRAAPAGSSVTVLRLGPDVEVRIASTVRWAGRGPVSVPVVATAVAALEPDGSGGQSARPSQTWQVSGTAGTTVRPRSG